MVNLSGAIDCGEARTFQLNGTSVKLPNTGAPINLFNSKSEIVNSVTYLRKQVRRGVVVEFA